MQSNAFLNCLAYNNLVTGIGTGSLLGIYDFSTGSGSAVIYNLLYPTGYNFSGNSFNGPAIPLISLAANISGYQFSGVNSYRLGYTFSGDFATILDINYNGCARNTTGVSYVLLSSATGSSDLNGNFILGINDANRLFFQTSGYIKTLQYELKQNDIIYCGLNNNINTKFGVFDILNQKFVYQDGKLPSFQNDNKNLYIGGLTNRADTQYTGYSGSIYNAIFTNSQLVDADISTCSNCLFATGFSTGVGAVTNISIPVITGYYLSGINENILTGYIPFTGQITKLDNSILNIIFPSGQYQLQQTQELATVLTGSISVSTTGTPIYTFKNDQSKVNGFTTYDIEFDMALTSGDTLEIYTYPTFNSNVNLPIIDFQYPTSNSFIQLIGNGLVETFNVDYLVDRGIVSGFFGDDILQYDLLTGASSITPFSGSWANSKIAMSGGSFYPTAAQFLETGSGINITGITGKGFSTKLNDVYINGQKMISGYNYDFLDDGNYNYFGGVTGLIFLKLYTGKVPDFVATSLYAPTGGLATGLINIEDSELAVLPIYNPFNRFYSDIVSDTIIYTSVSGFSEIVFLNGVRQKFGNDYTKNFSCTLTSGIVDAPNVPFTFFSNDTGWFNLN